MELIRHKLARALEDAVSRAIQAGALPAVGLPEVTVERPQKAGHGDYATNLGLKLARAAQMSPMQIAQRVAGHLPAIGEIGSVSVAPPGFINLTLSPAWIKAQVETILREGEAYGAIALGQGQRVQVEFVSVNPTGPVHIGHARGAVLGSTLASVLLAAGYDVTREYYVNDAGNQMDAFYRSLYARAAQSLGMQAEMPANGYMGAYVSDLANEILAAEPGLQDLVRRDPEAATRRFAEAGLTRVVDWIRDDLEALDVRFDVWFRERSLFESGGYERTMAGLRDGGYLAQREGATWFTSTTLGDDKDNVVVRSNGTPTYFASDIAYHANKLLERKFDQVIDIWGADHQGHVPRMKAAVAALGVEPRRLTVLIAQLVTLRRGDEIVRVSKRTGDLVTVREVVDEVGKDVCRFFLLARSADSQMDFDLELAKQQSQENPVYYVQYAHARICSILRLARERGIDYSRGDVSLLDAEAEQALIRKMLMLPELVEKVASSLEPHHLPFYAQELATAFHWFYKECRVVDDANPQMTAARLKLVEAARVVLARTLSLMGMSAPEQM
jgi:arginyl-tRNA synthetase